MGEGNYLIQDLELRAARAKDKFADYLGNLEAAYQRRRDRRHECRWPALAFCGMGRAGKDTAAEFVCARTGMAYPKSASWLVLPIIAHMAGVPEDQAWAERHQRREFWIAA